MVLYNTAFVLWAHVWFQWRNYNFWAPRQTFATGPSPPLNFWCQFKSTVNCIAKCVSVRHTNSETFTLSAHSLIAVLIHNSGHFGSPLQFWAPAPVALPELPMGSYATGVAWWCNGYGLGRLKRSRVQSPAVLLSGNNQGQVVDVVYCIYASVTKQYKLTLVKKRWRPAAEKVTVGLVLQWSCINTSVVYPPMG